MGVWIGPWSSTHKSRALLPDSVKRWIWLKGLFVASCGNACKSGTFDAFGRSVQLPLGSKDNFTLHRTPVEHLMWDMRLFTASYDIRHESCRMWQIPCYPMMNLKAMVFGSVSTVRHLAHLNSMMVIPKLHGFSLKFTCVLYRRSHLFDALLPMTFLERFYCSYSTLKGYM